MSQSDSHSTVHVKRDFHGNNNRILVLDDDLDLIHNYLRLFTSGEWMDDPFSSRLNVPTASVDETSPMIFDVVTAQQGEEGIRHVEESLRQNQPFAVAFIDIRMPPGMDGLETASAIRKIDSRIYIVIVTAYADRGLEEIQDVLSRDVLLMHKPFNHEEIFQMARNFCISWNRDVELTRIKNAIEEDNRIKDILLHSVTQDLRMPVNKILDLISHLSKTVSKEEQQEYLSVILNSSQSMLNTIDEILILSALDKQELLLERCFFDLNHLLHELHEMTEAEQSRMVDGKNEQLEIRTEISDHSALRKFFGDPARIRQIVRKLLHNAIKFTSEGEIVLAADVNDRNHQVHLSVADTGIGIAPEKQGRIFDRFFQVDASSTRQYGGLGLGLAIVRELVELMDGEINVISPRPEGGTVFHLTLPLET